MGTYTFDKIQKEYLKDLYYRPELIPDDPQRKSVVLNRVYRFLEQGYYRDYDREWLNDLVSEVEYKKLSQEIRTFR